MRTQIAVLEIQLRRMYEDIEAERRSRGESHKVINEHLLRQDDKIDKFAKLVYAGMGVLGALQFIAPLVWSKLGK